MSLLALDQHSDSPMRRQLTLCDCYFFQLAQFHGFAVDMNVSVDIIGCPVELDQIWPFSLCHPRSEIAYSLQSQSKFIFEAYKLDLSVIEALL